MKGIIDTLVDATKKVHGRRYRSHKFCYEAADQSVIEYDAEPEVQWKEYGETEHFTNNHDLKGTLASIEGRSSWFRYFLDGSRHTYKVDDMEFHKNVYPILAGQVGISCCRRDGRKMMEESFDRKIVMSVPVRAFPSEHGRETALLELRGKLNRCPRLAAYHDLQIDDVLTYDLDTDIEFEKKGIAKIQDYMIRQEKEKVRKLAASHKLGGESYLLKDGSLEYKAVDDETLNLSDPKMQFGYKFVLGISKSFNPTKCYVKGGGTNSGIIAALEVDQRTPAYRYDSKISGSDVSFCIWYLRLRDSRYTQNVFDGVIKVEKLIQKTEAVNGVDTETIDLLSAYLLKERNPVCYGADSRWANHLYPIYVTESFAKSRYISTPLFLHLF